SFQPGRAQMPLLPVPVDVPEPPKPVTPWPVRPRILWPLVGLAGTVALGAGTLGLLYLIGIIPPHPTPTNPEPIDKFVVNVHAPQQAIIKGSGDTRDQFVQAADPQGGVFSGKVPIDVSKLGSAPIRFTIDNRLERGHSVEVWVRLIADENLPENPLAQMRL